MAVKLLAGPGAGEACRAFCGVVGAAYADMIVSNLEIVPGYRVVRHLGLVQGSTVRAKHIGRDILAGFKNIVGGELKSYTALFEDSRAEATARMIAQAEAIGANAVVNVRFGTSSIAQGAAELLAYGTALLVEPEA